MGYIISEFPKNKAKTIKNVRIMNIDEKTESMIIASICFFFRFKNRVRPCTRIINVTIMVIKNKAVKIKAQTPKLNMENFSSTNPES